MSSNHNRIFLGFLIAVSVLIICSTIYLLSKDDEKAAKVQVQQIFKDKKDRTNSQTSFVHVMKSFPWTSYGSAVASSDTPEIQLLSTELMLQLVPYLVKSPTKSVNQSCVATPYKEPLFTKNLPPCKPLGGNSTRKVGVLLQFGFDVDALEIHLQELDGVVDKFFFVESIQTHSSYILKKPLIWKLLTYQERFAKFSEKVVHFVLDDSDLSKVDSDEMWQRESQQELLRWTKFLEWNNATNYFGKDDLLGFGDTDEVPNRDVVTFLKKCDFDMGSDSVDIGIWFPFVSSNTIFGTDYPVKGHPYTLGDPTFWKLSSAMEYHRVSNKPPNRQRGTSRWGLLGGLHFSRYAYPPMQMAKLLSASEAGLGNLNTLVKVGRCYADGNTEGAERILNTAPGKIFARSIDLDVFHRESRNESEAIVKIPWFLKCNRDRYPGFDMKHDPRL